MESTALPLDEMPLEPRPGNVWIRRLESPAGVAWLEGVSLFYIAAPLIIYLFGWLRLPVAALVAAAYLTVLVWGGVRAVSWARKTYGTAPPPDADMNDERVLSRTGLLAVLVAFVVACTGVGGLTFRFSDYSTYDTILRMLIEHPWPIGILTKVPKPDTHIPLALYVGYYLPAAVVGRMLGWEAAHLFSYFWNTFGMLLAVIWFLRLVGTFRLRYALLFLFFSGTDLIGYVFTTSLPDGQTSTWLDYLTGTFWWSTGPGWMAHWSSNFSLLTSDGQSLMGGVFYRFYGILSFLFDGPNHVLPGWVLLLVVLHDVLRRRTAERMLLLTAILPLCSVFLTMGTVPVLALSAVHTRCRRLFTAGNVLVGPIIVLILLLWYRTVSAIPVHDWLWEFQDVSRTWKYLLLYYISSFGLYVLVSPSQRADAGTGYRPGRLWFYAAVAIFVLAPWYRFGAYNDFTTKVVIPAQLVFILCLATALHAPAGRWARFRRIALATALVIGSWASLGIVYRALVFGFSFEPPPIKRVLYMSEKVEEYTRSDEGLQFHTGNFFWKYLARPVTYLGAPENRPVREYSFGEPSEIPASWEVFGETHRQTPEGLVLTTASDKPLLRLNGETLDTRTVGSVRLEVSVVDDQGHTPDFEIVLQWANEKELLKFAGQWPFHRWRSCVAFPLSRDPLSANPYWRGTIKDMLLFLKVNGDPNQSYVVTLRRLAFMER